MRWAGHESCMEKMRNGYKILVGKLERKRSLGSPKRTWEKNIKMDMKEIGYEDTGWIYLI
jgi:hypothetical protein